MNYNRVILGGFITRDPEVRATNSGMSIVSFGIAVNDKYKDKNTGEWKQSANFINLTAFGKTGEAIAKFFKKGSPILVEGKLKQERYKNKEGKEVNQIKVTVESFQFVEKASGNAPAPVTEPAPETAEPSQPDDKDIPF